MRLVLKSKPLQPKSITLNKSKKSQRIVPNNTFYGPLRIRKNFRRHRHSYAKRQKFRNRNRKRRRRRRRRPTLLALKKRLAKTEGLTKPRFGSLFIKPQRRNTFITLSRRVQNRAKNKFGKVSRKPQWRAVKSFSIGQCEIYKGRSKSSYIAIKAWRKKCLLSQEG